MTITCRRAGAQRRTSLSRCARQQSRIVFGSVDVERDQRVIDRNVLDVRLMSVFHFTRDRGSWNPKKRLNHFAPDKVGVPVPAGELGYDCPDALIRIFESDAQKAYGRGANRRAVHECHHGGVTAVVENLPQADLQRTELATTRIRIDDE